MSLAIIGIQDVMLNTKEIRELVISLCVCIMLSLVLSLHLYLLPRINNKQIVINQFEKESTLIPMMNRSSGQSIFQANIDYTYPQPTKVHILSGGCVKRISINYHDVSFNINQACNKYRGIIVDLGFAMKDGSNFLEIISDQPRLKPPKFATPLLHVAFLAPDSFTFLVVKNVLLACTCALIIFLLQYLTGEYGSGAFLSVAFLIFFHWFTHTNFMQYAMDMPGHIQYISYIAEYGRLPPTRDGWSFYHAPLYYALQAMVLAFGNYLGSFDPVGLLRIFNILYFHIFLIFGALTLQLLIKNRWAYYVALMLLFFYPSGILFSSRIDSHLLLYPFYAGFLYFLLRWIYEERAAHLGIALCLLGWSIATRTNAYILFPILIIALAYKWRLRWYRTNYFKSPLMVVGLIILIIGLGINKGRPFYYNNFVYKDVTPKVGNVEKLGLGLLVQNNITNFVYFDITSYLEKPFWNVWRDESGRQYFWNSMLKSSLFGEFEFGNPIVAKTLGLLLLWIIIFQLLSILMDWRYYLASRKWWICALLICTPVAALMRSRWQFPYACTQDFRYIYPALIAFCGMLGITIERCLVKKEYLIPVVSTASITMFSYYSSKFFLIQ